MLFGFGLRYSFFLTLTIFVYWQLVACGVNDRSFDLGSDEKDSPQNAVALARTESNPIHSLRGWTSLPINIYLSETITDEMSEQIENALHTWEMAVGKTLFQIAGHVEYNADAFPTLYDSLSDQENGLYLENNWSNTGKILKTLATTIWENDPKDPRIILKADLRFNNQVYFLCDSKNAPEDTLDNKIVSDLESLTLHEMGHFIGLSHVQESEDKGSIMNPRLLISKGFSARTLSKNDIKNIQSIYGCELSACDVDETYEQIRLAKIN